MILVEQSVNVALTTADKAFFMEKGAVRFHGLTAELLERPDLLRSIFLEGAAAATGEAGDDDRPDTTDSIDRVEEQTKSLAEFAVETTTSNGDTAKTRSHGRARHPARDQGDHEAVLRHHRGRPRLDPAPRRRDPRHHRPERRRQDHAVRPDLGLHHPGLGPGHLRRARHHEGAARSAARALGLARSFQDARLFGALTVHQAVCVALDRPFRVWDPIPAIFSIPTVTTERKLAKRADELIEIMGLDDFRDKFVSDLSTGSRRIVDLACQIGNRPKVVLFDEPSSGIAQRETEALGPLLLRIRDITGAAILVIEHDMPLITVGVGPDRRVRPRSGRGRR